MCPFRLASEVCPVAFGTQTKLALKEFFLSAKNFIIWPEWLQKKHVTWECTDDDALIKCF